MGIEIIRHKNYFFCLWIQNVGRIFEDVHKVQRRPCLCHDRFPFTRQWLGNHEHICNTVTDICGIHFWGLPWSARDTLFLYKLVVRFIYTDNGGRADHMDAGIPPAHPPFWPRTRHPPVEYTIPLQATA